MHQSRRNPSDQTPHVPRSEAPSSPLMRELWARRLPRILTGPADPQASELERVIFPGSFRPLHEGHRQMAAWAQRQLEQTVAFEISITNVDKLPLSLEDAAERLARFPQDAHVWLTTAPTFVEKASLFPGAIFLVGADTIARIAQSKYYENAQARDQALAHLVQRDCRFLVFGRCVDGRFCTVKDLSLPDRLAQLCRQVPEAEFRKDISSTTLRGR